MTITTNEIIDKYAYGKLSTRPEFYSGRGNNLGDLNSPLLEKLYHGVKTEVGPEAAKAFVNMVAGMTADASATTFLIAFKRLQEDNWKLNPHTLPKNEAESFTEAIADIHRSRGMHAATTAGTFGLLAILGGHQKPAQEGDGYTIIGQFISEHSKELDEYKRRKPQRYVCSYERGPGYF